MDSFNSSSSSRPNSLMPSRVLVVYDATRDRSSDEFGRTIRNIRLFGGIVHPGVTITVLGVLHKVLHPLGYQMGVAPENFLGATHARAVGEEVSVKADMYITMLQDIAEECVDERVDIEVKITAGTPIRKVIIQEVVASNPTWIIVDRHLRRESAFILKHVSSKVAQVLDSFSLEPLRSHLVHKEEYSIDDTLFHSLCKPVLSSPVYDDENNTQSMGSGSYHASIGSGSYHASVSSMEISDTIKYNSVSSIASTSRNQIFSSKDEFRLYPKLEEPGNYPKVDMPSHVSTVMTPKLPGRACGHRFSDVPVLCISCGLKTDTESKKYSYSELQLATNGFSPENILGEGGYGFVYKGKLKDGQQIAAKVRKESSQQGFVEFHSEVYVLNFARHKNIVMLLGYCCKENLNILVYEYVCNKSLEWHLFDNPDHVLEWHRRHAIAVGIAKGLRFLHEECRGGPIIHRDVRPSNILLTHDFVAMLGDFGLARWKTSDEDIQTKVLGTLGYLAPEYAENGIVSVRIDVYAFGIVLIQLISGRKPVGSTRECNQPSLRQWALPLLETLSFRELADPRLGDYNMFEMYHMARTAYLCLQTDPQLRPSMSEVLRLLEGESDRFNHLAEQFIPHYHK